MRRRPPSAPRAASRSSGCGCPTTTWSGPTWSAGRSASPPGPCPTSCWSIAEDRDIFSPAEMVDAFDVTRVSANPARFDLKKAEAINATHLRALPQDEFVARVTPFLAGAGLVADPPTDEQRRVLTAIAPLAQERMVVLSDAVGLLGFLFTDAVELDPAAAEKQLAGADAAEVLDAASKALAGLSEWTAAAIETALKEA